MEDAQLVKIFISYSHHDEAMRERLEKQLIMMRRQGIIETWHDRKLAAGEHIHNSINQNLENADIVLLMISPDFLASEYCYDIEMTRAMERNRSGEATVIPIIVRACDWKVSPFKDLNACPKDGTPINQATDLDQAFLEVAHSIREVAQRQQIDASFILNKEKNSLPFDNHPTSSNLKITKNFTDEDRDRYQLEGFDFIANFFEKTLEKFIAQNKQLSGIFRRIDANRFTTKIYIDGRTTTECTIFIGGLSWGTTAGIAFSPHDVNRSDSYQELLLIENDKEKLYFSSTHSFSYQSEGKSKLSHLEAAELYWSMFISPLQR